MRQVAFFLIVFLSWVKGYSCDCDNPDPKVEDVYQSSSFIFTAKVVSIRNSDKNSNVNESINYVEVIVDIIEGFKGDNSIVNSILNELTSCGTDLQLGETYLFYPFYMNCLDKWAIHQCNKMSGNIEEPYIQKEIETLRLLKKKTVANRVDG
jgi:hypothetical protein